MLDVHPPHEAVHGWRDFLLHIVTITIGLLIALGLEGLVEWQHHKHLVHEAEASLQREIETNAKGLPDALAALHKEQGELKHDVDVLNYTLKNKRAPPNSSATVNYHMTDFDDVSWRTAQASGALTFMPYAQAQQFADIYDTQEQLSAAERQAARDAILAIGSFSTADDNDPDPFAGAAGEIRDKVEVLSGQLLLIDSLYAALDRHYQQYLHGGHH